MCLISVTLLFVYRTNYLELIVRYVRRSTNVHTLHDLLYIIIYCVIIIVIHLLCHCRAYLLTYMHVYLTVSPACCAVNNFHVQLKQHCHISIVLYAGAIRQFIH